MSAFLTAYDLAERTERNEPEHHGAGETFAKPTGVPREVKTLDSLSDKEVGGMAGVKNRDPAWGNQRPCTYVIPAQKNILFFLGFLEGFIVAESFSKLALAVEEEVLWYFSVSLNTGVFPGSPETRLFI